MKTYVPKEIIKNCMKERNSKELSSSYVVFDTETTGIYPANERVIEIGAIKFVNDEKVATFSRLINPEREVSQFIQDFTGITNEELQEKETMDSVLHEFLEFIEDLPLVIHNAPFDIGMMAAECYRYEVPMFTNKTIDTVYLARKLIPKTHIENYSLSTLKEYLGLAYNSHRAVDDCEVCASVYQLYCNQVGK